MNTLELKGGVATYVETPDDTPKSSPMDIIMDCKALLASTDYKVTKNAECLALGLELPYNAEELHKERKELRDKINALEKEL